MSADDDLPDEIRSSTEVARRALTLFAVVGLALGSPRDAVHTWLSDNALDRALTPRERAFFDAGTPSRKQLIEFSWQAERLLVLLWALGFVAELPSATEQCDTASLQALMPPFADMTVAEFIGVAKLRTDGELRGMAETLFDLHWHARDGVLHGRAPRKPVDIEIVMERHHAINWVTGYCGLPWDEVTTDT